MNRRERHGGGGRKGTKMKINSKDFRVRPGEEAKLSEWPTSVKPFRKSKEGYQELLAEHVAALSSLQRLHYASNAMRCRRFFRGWMLPARTALSGT